MTLDDYLAGPGAAPWRWGRLDCTLFASGWVAAAIGADPGETFRGRYANALGAHRHIEAAGGLVALVTPELLRCGLVPTTDPQHGDVGVVLAPIDETDATREVAAIRCGSWWAVRGLRSIVFGEFPMVAAWALPKG